MLKKIINYITILSIISSLLISNTNASSENKKTYFRVTAYYSPLPNQSHYIKWNYENEIIMNGKWIKWASWKKVFSWMIAAPAKYKFWTKIKLKWLWIAEVSDRWGAIVKAWERNFKYDRIDIWCGYWEEWLQRAMFWGNRVIEWEILSENSKIDLDIKKILAPRWTIYHAIKNPDLIETKSVEKKVYLLWKKENKFIPIESVKIGLFSWPIKNKEWIKELQKIFNNMKLYSWEIDWEYSNIKNIVLKFQLENKVIKTKNDIWAWNFWPKTRKTLKEKYNLFLENEKKEKERIEKEKKLQKIKEEKIRKETEKRINNIWNLKIWDISPEVRQCQVALKQLWYFNYKDTAIFWEKTKQSIINYQLDKNVIPNTSIYWAWIFWPKTRKSIIEDLIKKNLEK